MAELDALRESGAPVAIEGSTPLPPSADIEIDANPGDWQRAALRLRNESGEEVTAGFTTEPLEVFVDRRKARAARYHAEYPGRHAGQIRWQNGRLAARILFDRSVLEVFADAGETVLTERVYPTSPLTRVEWVTSEAAGSVTARMWTLKSVWSATPK